MTSRSIFREPIWILATWCFFCAWVVGFCAWQYLPTTGIQADDENGASSSQVLPSDVDADDQRPDDEAMSEGQSAPSVAASTTRNVHKLALVLGLPAWVFWGIALPWCIATCFSVYYAMQLMDEETFDA